MNDNEQTFTPNFSDIPSLDDNQGLENYLNNAALAAQGVQVEQPAAQAQQPTQQPAAPAAQQPAAQPDGSNPTTPDANAGTGQLTQDQVNAIIQNLDAVNKRLGINGGAQGQRPTMPQTPAQQPAGYTPQEQQFINLAISRGYNLNQINQVIMQNRAKNGMGNAQNSAVDQRVAAIENFLKRQQYEQAQQAFINKASAFAEKWGLSDNDLNTFAQKALQYGINIADDRVDLEMVFRAVYPQQYAIRSQRMQPTNASQIYGGTSIPEGSRANASRLEDQYVEAFLKGTMPNQYAASNKK